MIYFTFNSFMFQLSDRYFFISQISFFSHLYKYFLFSEAQTERSKLISQKGFSESAIFGESCLHLSSFPNFRGTGYLFARRYAVMAGLATCLQVELSRLSLFLQVFVTVIWDRPVRCCYIYHSRSELGGISQHQTHVTRSASLWPSYR